MTETLEISPAVAIAHVTKCVNEPGVHLTDPVTLLSAQYVWNRMGEHQHQCYWNDRFVAAVMCGMDEQSQRIAAWAAVSNGLMGYWEWKTHCGFDMGAVLKHLGVIAATYNTTPDANRNYCTLPDEVCKALIVKFRLPTYCLCQGRADLTDEELEDMRELDSHYPKFTLLTDYAHTKRS
jgi:hypothetical protein